MGDVAGFVLTLGACVAPWFMLPWLAMRLMCAWDREDCALARYHAILRRIRG